MLKKKLRIDFLYLWTDNFQIEFPSLPFFMSLLLYSQGDIAFIAIPFRDLLRTILFAFWFAKECRKLCEMVSWPLHNKFLKKTLVFSRSPWNWLPTQPPPPHPLLLTKRKWKPPYTYFLLSLLSFFSLCGR